jgi:putative tryptophan/tyrosine transport system substrate-binding protein
VTTWPVLARAQQDRRVKLVGLLASGIKASEQHLLQVFQQTLQQLGWGDGDLRFEIRYGEGDAENTRKNAVDLVALRPEIIFAIGSPATGALHLATHSVPIVFIAVVDPVTAGYVASLARPGGNATGFLLFEYGIGGKWLELLKQIAPNVKRVAVLRDPTIPAGIGQIATIQSVAPSLGVEVVPLGVADVTEIERSIATFAASLDGGLILTASALSLVHRDLIIALAARHKLPAVYGTPTRDTVVNGGLLGYGPDLPERAESAASYVDRILRGEKPADLPVQAPTKYELMINLKTAKTLGLNVPASLLASADEVIE